ncbi:hypothetical protein HaLaN_31114, partial [Haematococcus lacustris]
MGCYRIAPVMYGHAEAAVLLLRLRPLVVSSFWRALCRSAPGVSSGGGTCPGYLARDCLLPSVHGGGDLCGVCLATYAVGFNGGECSVKVPSGQLACA